MRPLQPSLAASFLSSLSLLRPAVSSHPAKSGLFQSRSWVCLPPAPATISQHKQWRRSAMSGGKFQVVVTRNIPEVALKVSWLDSDGYTPLLLLDSPVGSHTIHSSMYTFQNDPCRQQ